MKILTITCHDVYNVGASLQAFALMKFLKDLGHDVAIIDYKPNYLSKHYSLTSIDNSRYDRFGIRQLYLLAKLPARIRRLFSKRKYNFDKFKREYLNLTEKKYKSYKELKIDCPDADLYIAGSDQIWNPLFQNGKDPAFYLQFVPEDKKIVSYAASFSTNFLGKDDYLRIRPWLEKFYEISVRESSGVNIISQLGLNAIQVCDPVFLLDRNIWYDMAVTPKIEQDYIFVYDFDQNLLASEIACEIAKKEKIQIISVFPMTINCDICNEMGPVEFLGLIKNARIVLSNSFHATAFCLIFHKRFLVMNRKEKLNNRMQELLEAVNLDKRMITQLSEINKIREIDWSSVDNMLNKQIIKSKEYINKILR